jgi:sugar O-acyltransferase (sialic acid O-acetyltransferase NeuD family)
MSERIPLLVFGAGGHGKVVAAAALACERFVVEGFLDDDPGKHGRTLLGLPVKGGLEALAGPGAARGVALGVGFNQARLAAADRITAAGHALVAIVHPAALVSTGCRIGDGSFVGPGAVLHVDASVGRACIVNSAAVVEHDCVLEDGVHLAPNATLGGAVVLRKGVHVGLGAVVLPNLAVGEWTVVGAGAVVIRSLPARVVAVGVPAHVSRRVVEGEGS